MAVLGIAVIIGWITNNFALIQIHPSWVPMQFNTALGFLLIGTSLISLVYKYGRFALCIGLLVGLIGLSTLIQYVCEVDLGIDEIFMKHDIVTKTSHPGRMAPNTALGFLITAIAISISGKSELGIRYKALSSAVVFALGFVALLGYILGVETSYGWGNLTRMAAHTSMGFIIAGLGYSAIFWNQAKEEFQDLKEKMNAWTDGYAVVLAFIIFSIDLSMPLGIAAGMLYALVILMAFNLSGKNQAYWYGAMATLCITLGYKLSPTGSEEWIVIVNRVMSVLVIWVIAVLTNRVKRSELDLLNANSALEEKVRERTRSLIEKNEEMSRIVYVTSHDLQEPLRTTKGMIDIFIEDFEDKLDRKSERYLKMILSSADRMTALVSSLLDYSRIGQKKTLRTVDLDKVLNEVQDSLAGSIQESNATIVISRLPQIKGYDTDLSLLFQNLLSNAIKFRKVGVDPIVEVTCQEKRDYWKFEVSDNGIGIDIEHRDDVFKIFTRLHLKEKYEGTGIGLAHCKKIVELHGGTISVVPSSVLGCIFKFTISKNLTDE